MTRSLNLSAFLLLVVLIGVSIAATPLEASHAASPAGALRGVPHVPEIAQSAERPVSDFRDGEVAGSIPALGITGGTPPLPQPAATPRQPVAAAVVPASASGAVVARYPASATWCAPTPTQCQGWGGDAMLAAVFSFRDGDRPYWVRVTRGDRFADVLVVSHCGCGGTVHAIDLSPAAFERLAPLSRGRIDVTVAVVGGPAVTLPPTDTPDQSGDDPPPNADDERMRREVRDDTLYEGTP